MSAKKSSLLRRANQNEQNRHQQPVPSVSFGMAQQCRRLRSCLQTALIPMAPLSKAWFKRTDSFAPPSACLLFKAALPELLLESGGTKRHTVVALEAEALHDCSVAQVHRIL